MLGRFRHFRFGAILGPLMPFFATLLALLVGAVMLLTLGANPLEAYGALADGAFGSPNTLADTVVKVTPPLFVGLGICIAFRGGVINIGGEGQLVAGAVGATVVALSLPNWPGWAVIPLCLVVGFLAGAIWGGISGVLCKSPPISSPPSTDSLWSLVGSEI
jgi:simple sugar transport system permease protein